MSNFERRFRDLLNPVSTSLTRWWCNSSARRAWQRMADHAAGLRAPGDHEHGAAARKARAAMHDLRDGDAARKAQAALHDLRHSGTGRKAEAALHDLRDSETVRKAKQALHDLRQGEDTRKGA